MTGGALSQKRKKGGGGHEWVKRALGDGVILKRFLVFSAYSG